jgi:hypothetical protein
LNQYKGAHPRLTKPLDDFRHDRHFVDLRVTHIYIQHFRAPGNLPLCKLFDVIKILLDQRLSQFLQASRIYLFPDYHERSVCPDDYFLRVTFQ